MDNSKRKQDVLEQLIKCKGLITSACYAAKVSTSAFYNWKNEDTDFAESVDEITELQIDKVESKLLELIDEGEVAATIFYMKTKGKKRGYQERTEVTGADGKDLIPKILIEIIGGSQDKSE